MRDFFHRVLSSLIENIFLTTFFVLIISLILSFFVFYNYVFLPLEREYSVEEELPSLNEDSYEKVLQNWNESEKAEEKNIFR